MNHYSIGIDIGGTNTDIGLVSTSGQVVSRRRLPTANYLRATEFMQAIGDAIGQLMDEHSLTDIRSIGIGAPNGNPQTGSIEANTPNLSIKERIPFLEVLGNRFHVPVALDNDANAAAIGEMIYGGAKSLQHFIMLTMGTGIGSGIVINRQILHGSTGTAGELGHTIVQPDGRLCGCGRKGCLEMYASARGICQNYVEAAQAHGKVLSEKEIRTLTCQMVGEAALAGDPIAMAAYDTTARWLGIALANAVAFSAPEAIFLMGGPTRAGEALMTPLKHFFEENLLFLYKDTVQLRFSELNLNEAAILGAAALGEAAISAAPHAQ
ncbi:MAG: ROK family protein [Bacteroidales bacterium]|nr:ROK family protein [Bacteroidales bacterium]